MPKDALTQEYLVGWAPGSSNKPPTENGSPLFITPVEDDTTITVTYNPSGTTNTFTLDRLEVQTIFDPDDDNTGMLITADKPVAVAWGEDPDAPGVSNGNPYLDMGYTTLPFFEEAIDRVIGLGKAADVNTIPPGGIVTFTLTAETYSAYAATDVDFRDTLPSGWTFVAGSTIITYPDSSQESGAAAETAYLTISGQDLTWDVSHNMAANETLTVSYQATAPGTPGTYSNEAEVEGSIGSDDFVSEDEVVVHVAGLVVDKDSTTPVVISGSTATYTLTLENVGTSPITGATMTDPLPTGFTYASHTETLTGGASKASNNDDFSDTSNPFWGTWTIPAGGNVEISLVVNVSSTLSPGTYDNDLEADSNETGVIDDLGNSHQDSDTPDGQDPEEDEDVTVVSMTIDKDTSTPSILLNTDASYTITLENLSGIALTGITVNDVLPAGFEFSSTQPGTPYSGSGYSQGGGFSAPSSGDTDLDWGPWTINAGGSLTISFDVTATSSVSAGTYDNTARASSAVIGIIDDTGTLAQDSDTPAGSDPESDEDVTVLVPQLTVDKDTTTPAVDRNGQVIYTIKVDNIGTGDAPDVAISDTLPSADFTFSATQPGSPYSGSGYTQGSGFSAPSSGDNALSWGPWDIVAGGSLTVTFYVDISGTAAYGTYDNTVTVTNSVTSPIDDNGTQGQDADTPAGVDPETDEDVTIQPMPVLDVTKSSSAGGSVSPGDTITYTITIENTGAADATNVVVSDPEPTGTTYTEESTVLAGPSMSGADTWEVILIRSQTGMMAPRTSHLDGRLRVKPRKTVTDYVFIRIHVRVVGQVREQLSVPQT